MLTDRPPRAIARRDEYARSDALGDLALPSDDALRSPAAAIEAALASGETAPVRIACTAFLRAAAVFYGVAPPDVKVLAARPLSVREGSETELFGDYEFETARIRVWMRTAVHKRVTSYGTFLSTLCHEFCHHLDRTLLGFPTTYHTRGFYERTAALYHHARGTPRKPLAWRRLKDGSYTIDWARVRSPP